MARKQPGDTQPFLDHDTLTQRQQAKHLGVKEEVISNLGHACKVSDAANHPLGKPINYDTAPQAERQIKEGQRFTQGVYGRHVPINSGISTAENLQAWSKYSQSNTYDGRDPKGRGVGSDGHLAKLPNPNPSNWADFRAGSESGEGRLEKLHRK
jgi:hypothetical protein